MSRSAGQSAPSEWDLIAALERVLASTRRSRSVRLGIGDDAAVLSPVREPLVWSIDAVVEGVHFDRRWLDLTDVGARALHAAASDLCAMGARPVAALAALVLPEGTSTRDVEAIARGQAEAGRELSCPVVGGNVSRGSELGITTTVLGAGEGRLCRSAARPRDELWLIGDVGLAKAGLLWLSETGARRRRASPLLRQAAERCVRAWRRPQARVREGIRLANSARAVIDVSDGLVGDAMHIATASRVKIVIDSAALSEALCPELERLARALGRDPLELALDGGEDYALLATGPEGGRPRGARWIGRLERGCGVELETEAGERKKLSGGFDHFRV